MRTSILTSLLFAALARAIQINTPTKDEKVALASSSYTVTWSTVSTDPTTAHLFLVNNAAGHTQYSKDLGAIDLTLGTYTVAAIAGLSPDSGYQFNIQSVTTTNTGILAQSQQFSVVAGSGSGSSGSSSSSSGAATTATSAAGGAASSATILVASGSSTASTLTTATASASGSSSGSNSSASATATPTRTATSGGGKAMGFSVAGLMVAAAAFLA